MTRNQERQSIVTDTVTRSAGAPESIDVMVATQRQTLLRGLRRCLADQPDLAVREASVESEARFLASVERRAPRILLLDHRLLERVGAELRHVIRSGLADLRVILLCDELRPSIVEDIVRSRFYGALLTNLVSETCVNAIRKVDCGELWIPRILLKEAIFALPWPGAGHDSLAREAVLTRRERQAVRYVRRGLTNKEIACELGVREDTVKKHLCNAYAKLGVHSRMQLVTRKVEGAASNG
jgi:DNA-binding NarL/FixJ family response regulator